MLAGLMKFAVVMSLNIWTGRRWAYLALVMNLYTRLLVGGAMPFSPNELTGKALSMVYERQSRLCWTTSSTTTARSGRTVIMMGYLQTKQKISIGKTLKHWPILLDHHTNGTCVYC